MGDVEHRPREQFLLAVAQELAHRGVDAEETGGSELDLDLADSAGIEHDTERRFALAESGLVFLTFRKIIEMAHDAETAVGHGHPLDLPIIGFNDIGVLSPLDTAWRVKRLAGVEGVAKAADGISRKRLGPDAPHRLREVTADQRPHVLEFLFHAGAHLHDAKIGVHRVDPDRRILDELTKRDFAGAQTLLGTFDAGNVGDCRDQPDDFALLAFWLVAAMHELRLANLVRHFDFELDRVAGEALADVAIDGSVSFLAKHIRNSLSDDLLGRETKPLRIVSIDELVAGLRVAMGDSYRGVVGDQPQLALAVAQQTFRRLSLGGGLPKLRHQRVDFGDGRAAQRQRAALSQSCRSASRLADRARDYPAQPQGQGNHQRKRRQSDPAEGPPQRPNRSLEQGLGLPYAGVQA